MVATLAGVKQVVTLTEKHVVGVSAADGALLWSHPFTTDYDQNAVTPIIQGDLVIVSGLDNGVTALRIARAGAAADREAGLDERGRVVLHELAGARGRAAHRLLAPPEGPGRRARRGHRQAGAGPARAARARARPIVVAGDVALVMTTEGELLVVKHGAEKFTPVATYTVATSPVWAHLAVAPGAVLVKDLKTLALWRVP